MFFVSVCGLSLIFTSSCFRAKLLFRSPWRRCCMKQETPLAFIGVKAQCVAAGGSLFSTSDCDVSCSIEQTVLRGGRVKCSKDFFFTWFWYHVAWSQHHCVPGLQRLFSILYLQKKKRMCAFVSASSIGKVLVSSNCVLKLDVDVPQNCTFLLTL